MEIVIRREPLSALSEYGSVPIAFPTTTVLEVTWISNGLGGVRMVEAPLCQPLTKDFDGDEPVTRWTSYGDISHWGIFGAFVDERRVGGGPWWLTIRLAFTCWRGVRTWRFCGIYE